MTIPKFFLEISNKKNTNSVIWSRFKKKFIFLNYKRDNLSISFHNFYKGKICILGTPILKNKINNNIFAELFIQNQKNNKWLKTIDGEFVIIYLKNKEKLQIISSRFNFPTIWYYLDKNIFLTSISLIQIIARLKELGKFRINEQSLFEFLLYRRVFGEKTSAIGAKIINPATRLIYNGVNIKSFNFWSPNFKEKTNDSLNTASDKLIYYLSNSLKKKTSDKKRFGLFLSGGMDTRLILACAKKNNIDLSTFTFNSFENREVKVAREVAKITKTPHYFVQNKPNHYNKVLPEAVYSTASMYQPLCLFYSHSKFMKKYIDIGLHGHGFDFFFQGMYLPRRKLEFFNKKLDFLIPIKIKENNIDYFLKNISYKTKGSNILNFFKKKNYKLMLEKLVNDLKEIEVKSKKFCNLKIDLYEFLTFGNLARHYSVCDNISMNSITKIRTPSYDNDLYDFYQQLPWRFRFDSRIQRLSLKKLSPKLANLESSNTNMPISYSSSQKTFFQFINFIKKRFIKKEDLNNDLFQRMGLPIGYLIKNDWEPYVKEIIKSERLSQIKFLDFGKIKNYLKTTILDDELQYDQFTMLLISIDNFLKLTGRKINNA